MRSIIPFRWFIRIGRHPSVRMRPRRAGTREGFLAEVADKGSWLIPMHFPGACGYKICREKQGYRFICS